MRVHSDYERPRCQFQMDNPTKTHQINRLAAETMAGTITTTTNDLVLNKCMIAASKVSMYVLAAYTHQDIWEARERPGDKFLNMWEQQEWYSFSTKEKNAHLDIVKVAGH